MPIFDFLVLKIKNFGFENPCKHVLGKFGQFWKNPKISALFERGGGEIGITQNFGKEFFSGTCNFSKNENFEKQIFLARD